MLHSKELPFSQVSFNTTVDYLSRACAPKRNPWCKKRFAGVVSTHIEYCISFQEGSQQNTFHNQKKKYDLQSRQIRQGSTRHAVAQFWQGCWCLRAPTNSMLQIEVFHLQMNTALDPYVLGFRLGDCTAALSLDITESEMNLPVILLRRLSNRWCDTISSKLQNN